MSTNTNSKKHETAENLSPATLAKIAQIKTSEADGRIDKKTAERYIRITNATALGKRVNVSNEIDFTQMMNANKGINRIGVLLMTISENISHKTLDPEDGSPLKCATIDSYETYSINELLKIAMATLIEIETALMMLCADC